MPKIKTLKVREFRGIRDTSLELGGKSLLLLGENGTGKSSFIDALEFFYTGSVSHLEGAQGISTARHAPHIRANQDNVAVTVEFDQPHAEITRTLKDISNIPPELLDHYNLGASAKFILRRKNLLDFILSQPASRYEQLAAIVGVSELDSVERAF
ncbi:MAG: AAA family ATPase, partial [Candidatus Margulisiibacteriota bacterium]